MQTVGLWGFFGEEQARLQAALPRQLREGLRFASFPAAAQLMAVSSLALLAVAPEAEPNDSAALPPCQLLLLPGSERNFLARAPAKCVISYGGSGKDSVTLSSRTGEGLLVAIQRSLPTLAGGSIERQELRISAGGQAPQRVLFFASLLLVLGCPMEELSTRLPRCFREAEQERCEARPQPYGR